MPEHTKSKRVWQRMLSGRRLDLMEPSPLDVEIDDIAHGLARVARWNGQTRGKHAFSVAQHSVLVLDIFEHMKPKASLDEKLIALLHDAPEYVVGDMISPFKAVMGGDYKAVEDRLFTAILLRFSLPAKPDTGLLKTIKKADSISAFFEATQLAGFSQAEAGKFFGRPRGISSDMFDITPMSPEAAQREFLERFGAIERAKAT